MSNFSARLRAGEKNRLYGGVFWVVFVIIHKLPELWFNSGHEKSKRNPNAWREHLKNC